MQRMSERHFCLLIVWRGFNCMDKITTASFVDDDRIKVAKTSEHLKKRVNKTFYYYVHSSGTSHYLFDK